jgi:hypothetical protein
VTHLEPHSVDSGQVQGRDLRGGQGQTQQQVVNVKMMPFQTVPLLLCEDYSSGEATMATVAEGVESDCGGAGGGRGAGGLGLTPGGAGAAGYCEGEAADDDFLAHLPVCQSFWARRHSSLSSSRGSSEKYALGSVEEELNFLHLDMHHFVMVFQF